MKLTDHHFCNFIIWVEINCLWFKVASMSIISPAGFCPERQIQRKPPSVLHVYKGKYLQLKYSVSIPEKISICVNRSSAESLMMMFHAEQCCTPTSKKWLE